MLLDETAQLASVLACTKLGGVSESNAVRSKQPRAEVWQSKCRDSVVSGRGETHEGAIFCAVPGPCRIELSAGVPTDFDPAAGFCHLNGHQRGRTFRWDLFQE